MEKLYELVKNACDEQGTTIKKVEEAAGIGNGVVGKWRKGSARIASLEKISKVINIPTVDLVKAAVANDE